MPRGVSRILSPSNDVAGSAAQFNSSISVMAARAPWRKSELVDAAMADTLLHVELSRFAAAFG